MKVAVRRVLRTATLVTLLAAAATPLAAQTDPADAAWRAGDTDRATELYEARLAAAPNDVVALHRLGLMRAWVNRFDDSLSLFDRLLQLEPGNREARHDRARVLAWAGRYRDAVASYEAMLRDDPADVEALLGLATVHSWAGRTAAAEEIYERVLAVDPHNREALRGRARVAAWAGDLREGERRWREAIAAAPDDAEALAGLAQTLRWQGRDAAANEVARHALTITPDHAATLEQLEWINVALRPRVSPGVTYEYDSDGNRITTFTAGGAARPAPRLELRLDAYLRSARAVSAAPDLEERAYGGTASLWHQFEPGWALSGGIGAATSDVDGARVTPSYAARLTTPERNPVTASLGVSHAAFDATALLVQRQVTMTDVSASLATTLPGEVRARANGSVARFRGRVSGAANTRTAGGLSLSRRVLPPLTIALQGRAFAFDRDDIFDGYFAPDFYGLAELSASFAQELGAWSYSVEAAPGVQKVRTDGASRGSVRAAGRLQYMLRPGRAIALSGTFSNAGLQSLSPAATSEYRYRAVTLTTQWGF